MIGLSAAVVYLLVSGPTPTREISWQEFRRKYLDRGEVGEGRWGEVGSLVRAWQSVVWDVGRGGFTGQRWVHWSEVGSLVRAGQSVVWDVVCWAVAYSTG